MDQIQAMRASSGFCKELWAQAACTASYIRNRSPALGRFRTPWKLFFDKKPDVANIWTSGAEAYALAPKELRRKLDDHSELGRFVGCPANTQGYRTVIRHGGDRQRCNFCGVLEENVYVEEPMATRRVNQVSAAFCTECSMD